MKVALETNWRPISEKRVKVPADRSDLALGGRHLLSPEELRDYKN